MVDTRNRDDENKNGQDVNKGWCTMKQNETQIKTKSTTPSQIMTSTPKLRRDEKTTSPKVKV